MVVASLSLGALVGVVLSAGFIWLEVGRYATPQVPVTLFDERKLLAAYTVGLFVGVPLAASYLLLVVSVANAALPGTALFLAGVVGGAELAQLLLLRSVYWGAGAARPFYAVALRAGVGGILALAAVAAYLGGVGWPTAYGLAACLLTAVALVVLEVAGAVMSIPRGPSSGGRPGGPLVGVLFGGVAFFLLAIGPVAGPVGSVAAPLVILLGAGLSYRGRRGVLADVPPPTGPRPPTGAQPLPYGRTDPSRAGAPGRGDLRRPPRIES